MKSIFYTTMILLGLDVSTAMENNKRKLDDLYENPQTPLQTKQQAIVIKDPAQLVKLSVLYKKGRGVPQDYNKALFLLKETVNQDDAEAKFKMTRLLVRCGVKEYGPHEIISLLHQAAQQGYPRAQYELGRLYQRGSKGFKQDTNKALELFQQAADQGDANAQFMLGFSYLRGFSINQNLTKALNFLQLAADQEHIQAQYYLASMFYKGDGVTADMSKAFTFWKRAAHLGDDKSQLLLGRLYKKGFELKGAFIRNYKKALSHFMLVLNTAGNEEESLYINEAQFYLGLMYEKGKGVEKDYARAAQHYKEIRARVRRDADEDPYGIKAKKRLKKLLTSPLRTPFG